MSNIFCIQFESTNRNFYSCGNDGFLIHYDLTMLCSSEIALAHEGAATRLSVSPDQDELVLTAG